MGGVTEEVAQKLLKIRPNLTDEMIKQMQTMIPKADTIMDVHYS